MMMLPAADCFRCGIARRVTWKVPVTLIAMTVSQRVGVDRFDRCGRTANAGIVDEDIEPAERLDRGDHRIDVRPLGVVAHARQESGHVRRAGASASR